ncbi:MAG: UDP-2,3-diacylglucosamine diphosphatase [Balneolales bacterium]|nr:UDP-2,3-diacylglucosamine diphosphatase [Balneolales bacterium]
MSEERLIAPIEGDVVFISDVHLGGYGNELNEIIEQRFLSFLDFLMEKKLQLCILGDLFDYWMEYRGVWPAYGNQVLEKLEMFNRQSKVLYITGNHDNWIGPRMLATGMDIEGESRVVHFGNKRALLLHGDGLKDKKMKLPRPAFHRLLRNSYFLKIYQSLIPPLQGIELMRQFSHKSKLRDPHLTHQVNAFISPLDKWALDFLEKGSSGTDIILCGHHHRPVYIERAHRLYLNLGNFGLDQTLALYTNGKFLLVRWNAQNATFLNITP